MSDAPTLPIPEGIAPHAWEAIGAKPEGNAWSIPEYDSTGEIVGHAIRRADGIKTFKPGEHRGLTLAWPLNAYAGTTAADPLLIVEGATCTAAGMGLSFDIVGRPSCTGGVDHLRPLVKGLHVCIVAENDQKPSNNGTPGHWPGRDGAERVAAALAAECGSVRIAYPPKKYKDLRAWIIGGATRADVEKAIKSTEPVTIAPDAPQARDTYRPFPIHLLPEPLRSFVPEAARAIGCDPACVALPALAGCAGAIGNTRRVKIKGMGWTEPAVVWCVAIASSGTQKSPGQEAAVVSLQEKQLAALDAHDEDMLAFKAQEADYDAAMRDWKNTGRQKNEPQPERPAPPVCSRTLVSDVTIEGLAPHLADSPRGLLLERDELNGWLQSFDQYKGGKGGDVNHWLTMHRAGLLLVDRKTGDRKTIRAPRAAISITGTIQPATLTRVLTPEFFANGLAARLLLAMPPKRRRQWTDAELSDAKRAALAHTYDNLLALDFAPTDGPTTGKREPVYLELSPEARAAFIAFFTSHNDEAYDLPDDLAAAFSKLEAYAPRFALIVHCIRCASGDRSIVSPITIDLASMEAGIGLVHWFANEARRVYAMLGESDDKREDRALLDRIRGWGRDVSASELTKRDRRYQGDSAGADLALRRLVKRGWGTWVGNDGGRWTQRFRPTPVPESPSNSSESGGIDDVDTGDAPENAGDGWGEA